MDIEVLQRWYQTKYNSLSNRDFEDNILDDVLIDYYYDLYKDKPNEQYRNQDGEIQYSTDGADPVYDQWEKQAARGEDVDLWEAFKPEQKEEILRRLERNRQNKKGLRAG